MTRRISPMKTVIQSHHMNAVPESRLVRERSEPSIHREYQREIDNNPMIFAMNFERQNDAECQSECDALIEQAIREKWHESGFGRFRNLKVGVRNGKVQLRGRLDSYYHKQMAHSLIRAIDGITQIDNDILVQTVNSSRQ
ncbi:MAG: BON domain-containing protein [Planctomycetaceae bacterium]